MQSGFWPKRQPVNHLIPFRDRYKPSTEAERLATQERRNRLRLAEWQFHHYLNEAAA